MELIDRAMALCAEIEEKQAELRAILQHLCEKTEAEEQTVEDSALEEVCDEIKEPEASDVTEPEVIVRPAKPRADIHKAFTINDRFRFRRELFAGDDNALSVVIDHLATLDTLAEADSYLSTMPWDSESEALSEFMAIVANHFNGFRG